MEMLTAVLAGERNLELRVFAEEDHLTVVEEKKLTARLCRLMDNQASTWRR